MDRPALLAPSIDDDLAPRVRLGLITVEPVVIAPASPALLAEIAALETEMRCRYGEREPSAIPELKPARELYHALGIDPTRTRPSSEALLRRILKQKPFPLVNNAVDWCNLAAVSSHLSLGLYDSDQLLGPVTLRRGRGDEAYQGIRKDEVHLDGRPTLADDRGPFGNPTSDSLRTSVTNATRALLLVVFAPASYPRETLAAHTRMIADGFSRHLAGPGVVPASRWQLLP